MADVRQGAEQQPGLRRRARRVEGGGPQPADRAEPAEVGRGSGDVRPGAQTVQVQVGVVPAHPVQQLRQLGGRAGGDEEAGPAGGGGAHRAQRQPHPFEPDQRPAAGRLGDLDHVEGRADRQQQGRAGVLRPGLGRVVEAGARRDRFREGEGVRARGRTRRVAAGALPGDGARAGNHVPAPQSCVLGHRCALRGAYAAACAAGPHLTNAADRETHAPSNGSSAPVVTTRSTAVTLRHGPSPSVARGRA